MSEHEFRLGDLDTEFTFDPADPTASIRAVEDVDPDKRVAAAGNAVRVMAMAGVLDAVTQATVKDYVMRKKLLGASAFNEIIREARAALGLAREQQASRSQPEEEDGASVFMALGGELAGHELLDHVRRTLTRFVVFPSPEAADAAALYVACTHAQPAWEHATRLVIKSPLKRCGKTRLEEVIAELSHAPLQTANISVAALVRSIGEKDPPVIILDEGDAIFGRRKGDRPEGAEDLRGILNAGFRRGWPYIRWDPNTSTREECPTFAMAIIGGIGGMPDTIEDRAVMIMLRRRAPGEKVDRFRLRSIPPLHQLRDQLHAWARAHLGELRRAEPKLPAEDRAADVWEPLVAVADLAGGDWPARARAACTQLTGDAADLDDGTAGERLLADLKAVYGTEAFLYTKSVIERLTAIEEAPWSEWTLARDGKGPIKPRGLASLLKQYGIKPRDGREHGTGPNLKGYYAADLADTWNRYVPPGRDIRNSATDGPRDADSPAERHVADTVADAVSDSATSLEQGFLTDVADVAHVADERALPVHVADTVAESADSAATSPEQAIRPDVAAVADVAQKRSARGQAAADDDSDGEAAEAAALALIGDVLGGEVIDRCPEGRAHTTPMRWRTDDIPTIGDDPDGDWAA